MWIHTSEKPEQLKKRKEKKTRCCRTDPFAEILVSIRGFSETLRGGHVRFSAETTANGKQTTCNHNGSNQMLSSADDARTIAYKHDADGNRIEDERFTYRYDANNRLAEAVSKTDPTNRVRYFFDAFGQRVARITSTQTQHFVTSDDQVLQETTTKDGKTTTSNHVYGNYIDEPLVTTRTLGQTTTERYYIRNQQYSITALTDSSGNITERYGYSKTKVPGTELAETKVPGTEK